MRTVIFFLILLAVTVGLMLQIRTDSGYVLMSYGEYSVETSLVVLIAGLLLFFFAVYALIRLVSKLLAIPTAARRLTARRRQQRAGENLQKGLLQMAEGDWAQAQRNLVRHADESKTEIVHYLSAARAAQMNNDNDARDTWLGKAKQAAPHAETALGLVRAELQYIDKQYPQALATLRRLYEKEPQHPYVLRLLALTHSNLGEWQELEAMLSRLEQYKVFDKEDLRDMRLQLWNERLEEITNDALAGNHERAAQDTKALWDKTNRGERENSKIAMQFAKAWHACKNDEAASNLCENLLKKQWHDEAAELYGWLNINPQQSLRTIETWQQQYGDKSSLLLTAARVCVRQQLWGRARSLLNHVTTTEPSVAAWRELAALEEQQGDAEAAIKAWRAAATMGSHIVTPLIPKASSMYAEALDQDDEQDFVQPDVAGPECFELGNIETPEPDAAEIDDSSSDDDQLELPVTPAAAYSKESK